MASWYFSLAAFMSFVGSFLVRNVKAVSSLLYILYAGVFFIFLGLAIQYFATSYSIVLVGSAFFGLSIGFLGMAQNNLVILGSTSSNRSRMLSFLHSMYGMASLMAPLYVAWLSDHRWQEIIMYFAWVALLYSVIGLILNFQKKDTILHYSQFQESASSGLSNLSELKIAVAISLYVVAEIMIGTRLALYVRRYSGYDLQDSSLYVTMFFAFLLMGRLVVSYSTFSMTNRKWILSSLVGSFVLILIGIFIHPFAFVISGLTMGPFYPLGMAYVSQMYPFKSTSIVSWTLAMQSIFIVIMHWGIGKLTDLVELNRALLMGPIFLLISFFIIFFIREERYA